MRYVVVVVASLCKAEHVCGLVSNNITMKMYWPASFCSQKIFQECKQRALFVKHNFKYWFPSKK